MLQYCETLLGAQNHEIKCMDQSACKGLFPQSELTRFLTPKLMELFLRIKQRKEIAAAGLHGLEECPFCDFKMVIENEQEKLFRCQNDECLAVSCRQCKKPVCKRRSYLRYLIIPFQDHLPKSCQGLPSAKEPTNLIAFSEMEVDRKLDGKHAIEEALCWSSDTLRFNCSEILSAKALMRNCPKCQKGASVNASVNSERIISCPTAFIKEDGCNKMTCPECRTLSCYIW
jgi:E3 ubiquitin-protein ligase RNF216